MFTYQMDFLRNVQYSIFALLDTRHQLGNMPQSHFYFFLLLVVDASDGIQDFVDAGQGFCC